MKYIVTEENKKEVLEKLNEETSWFQNICNSFGYEACHPWWNDGFLRLELNYFGMNKYAPEIYLSNISYTLDKTNKINIKIQTTSYGPLNEEEFESFLGAQNNARNLVHYLNDFDFKRLPEIEIVR